MLETIREFAVERLEESAEADEVRRRHAEYLAELAEASQTAASGSEQMPVREQFRVEWDNVRAALTWALESGETELGLRIAGSLTMSWLDRNQAVEGERWLRALLAGPGQVDDTVRANALMTASNIAGVRSDFDQAAAWGMEALEHFRVGGSELGLAWSLTTMATIPLERGDLEQAGLMLEEAEALHRKIGDPAGIRRVLHLQGQQAAAVGDVEQSRRLLREAAELSRADGDLFSASSTFHSLGNVELESGEIEAAERAYRDALRFAWDCEADRLVCYSLAGLAAVAAERGDAERAALLWGFAEAYEKRLRFTFRRRSLYAERLDPVTAAHPEQRDSGRRLDVDAAVDVALSAP
jgi:tetratricopeptide (TPR) repeat protein